MRWCGTGGGRGLAAIIVLLAAGLAAGMASPAAGGREDVYARATRSAGAVLLFKPLLQDTQRLETVLAPFVLQSVGDREYQAREWQLFGAPLPGQARSNRIVYFHTGSWSWGGVVRTQMTYLWLYAEEKQSQGLPVQGVRVTLNAQGQPVIWEMLASPSSRQEIYVAGSVEHASRETHGGPLPGRRFAVEPSLEEAPMVVMPALVEDSAVVFGPMVYLEARTRGPHAVICRCMPALATEILDTVTYELAPWPEDARRALVARRDGARIARLWEEFQRQAGAGRLRLPGRF